MPPLPLRLNCCCLTLARGERGRTAVNYGRLVQICPAQDPGLAGHSKLLMANRGSCTSVRCSAVGRMRLSMRRDRTWGELSEHQNSTPALIAALAITRAPTLFGHQTTRRSNDTNRRAGAVRTHRKCAGGTEAECHSNLAISSIAHDRTRGRVFARSGKGCSTLQPKSPLAQCLFPRERCQQRESA